MNVSFIELFVLGLACFRLTRLIVFDQITAFIRNIFIDEVEEMDGNGQKETYLVPKSGVVKGFIGELLSCFWCTGVWASIFLCLFYLVAPSYAIPLLLILAVAGLGALIEILVQKGL
jgi:hypothetical protein